MRRKKLGYTFLACWMGITALIAINRWDIPISYWLAATFGLVGIVSGFVWLVEVE